MAAAKRGASEANIDLLASQEAPLLGQLEAIHAKALAKFYATLTPDQKAKADELRQKARQRMEQRMEKGKANNG